MPLKVADRVKEYTTSSGIGGVSFIGAYNGFQRFDDALTSGDTTYYVIEENDKWEVGVGTYGSNNLERDTILASSNNGSKISLGGSGTVSIVYPADKAVFIDDLIVVSGVSNYASGQAVINQDDIVAVSGLIGTADFLPGGSGALIDQNTDQISSVSGWADYTFLKTDDDTYVSGIATYASGQSVENEIGISSVSGIAAYASGHNLQGITDNGSTTTNAITVSNNNITASSGLFDSLDMTPLAEADYPSHQEGVLFYDSDNHTISLYNDEADVTLQLGQEEFLRVRNNTGATITNGTAVLITGSHGNAAPTISGAIATSESASQVVGLATHDIEDSSFGYVTTYGIVRNVDTSHCSDGDEIFLSATQIGSGVNVSPTIPNYKVTIGHVIRSHGANGSVLVQIGHPKLGGGDLKSEAELNLSGVPFVTSIADTTAGGSQTDPLFIFDSNNRQLQIGSGIQLLDGEPSNTSNVLYNNGGSLKFNGLPVGSVTSSQLDYVSGVSVYGSGQSIENENDIVSVSGIASYASGQAIANESDIVAVSGLIGVADFLPGATGTLIDQNAQDIVTASGALRASINQNVLDISSVSGLLTPSGDSFTFSNAILTYFNSDGGSFSADLSSISGDVYASIVDGAPETLNTLNEIAAAIDDDQNIATTLTNLITSSSGNLQSQITSNDSDIVAVSGIAVYASGKAYDDTYLSGIAVYSSGQAIANESDIAGNTSSISTNTSNISTNTSNISTNTTSIATNTARVNYASGQAIANESDIVAVSGIAVYASGEAGGGGGSTYTAGSGLTLAGTEFNVYGGSGHFQHMELSTDNIVTPTLKMLGSGVNDTPINLEVRSSFQSATGSGTALLFQGTQGQLFSITDNLSSGTIFNVSDITGLPMLEVTASGDVEIGEFADNITIHQPVRISGGVPADTTDKLYNDAGTLKFNGSSIGGVDAYTSGIATYASGQAIENEADILAASGYFENEILELVGVSGIEVSSVGSTVYLDNGYVSGIATYASGQVYDDTYVSGIASYASGQAIQNDTDITYLSGIIPGSQTAGSGLTLVSDEYNIYGGTGNFQQIDLTSDNYFVPNMLFTGSGVNDTPIRLKVLSSHASASTSGTALSFEGTQGQLFGVTDNLSSGTIFSVNDITGLPMIEVDASGDVKVGRFANSVVLYSPSVSGSVQGNLDVTGAFSATTKSFLIDHPSKEGMRLQYASLEGPENGVYVRGTTDEGFITLPDYWRDLVHNGSITVTLTPVGQFQPLFVEQKNNREIRVGGVCGYYDYVVYGERKDVDKLEVEW